jgi:hypothetical protein
MVSARLIASYLYNLQPASVRKRLLDDVTFGASIGVARQETITLGPDVHIDRRECYAAVRRAFAGPTPASLVDIKGHEIRVTIEQGQVILGIPSLGRASQVSDFMCFSPNFEQRTQTLSRLIDRFGPTAPDFLVLLTRAEEHELSDDEIDELFTEATTGVGALQRRAISAVKTHQATLQNLVPASLVYFERFCGPHITSADHEEYFCRILPQYRKALIHRDLIRGLDISLQGSLRDDLMPAVWTEHVNDDELWDALIACDPWPNPFALLGALDIAIGRQHDDRYRIFAEEAVRKLVQEKFPRPDGLDVYELLPLLADLVLNRMNSLEGGVSLPPCWKRMCAWMQAGFLMRLMQDISLELESFREWIRGQRTLAVEYAKEVDLRHEPMYRAAEMSPRALREEVIGRLVLLHARHKAGGRIIPGEDAIRGVLTQLAEYGLPLRWGLPGPLEGHYRPAETSTRKLPDENIQEVTNALVNDQDGSILSILAQLAQRYDLGEELLARMREMIAGNPFAREDTGLDERLGRLIDAGLVACAQRDEELATGIASIVVATAHRAQSGTDATKILQALLVASAAFQHEDAWGLWLENQLTEVATRLPVGEPSRTFLMHLQELKKVLKLNFGIHVRAEALASAAN